MRQSRISARVVTRDKNSIIPLVSKNKTFALKTFYVVAPVFAVTIEILSNLQTFSSIKYAGAC